MRPRAGDPAPEFSGTTTDGSRVSLKDFRGKKLILYFYPMDDTPGCTAQACSLRDHNAEIAGRGAAILGVSAQDAASHQKFTRKHKLNFPLLADTDRSVAKAYGVLGSGLFGVARSIAGFAERVTFIIDEHGRIAQVIDDPHTRDHAQQVLGYL
jgi:peroxiredoxin Q/BCP